MDEKLESSLSPIKNSGFDIIEEKSNELFEWRNSKIIIHFYLSFLFLYIEDIIIT
jgi:hypothetical protein